MSVTRRELITGAGAALLLGACGGKSSTADRSVTSSSAASASTSMAAPTATTAIGIATPGELCARARADRRAVLHRWRGGAQRHQRGESGRAAAPGAHRRRRQLVCTRRQRRGRDLACRCRRELLGVRIDDLEPHVPAGHPADGRRRGRSVRDHLPRLVPGPGGAHPRESTNREHDGPHRPALFRRRPEHDGLRPIAVQRVLRRGRGGVRLRGQRR